MKHKISNNKVHKLKRYKKYWFYLSLALSVSLTILVINDINDKAIPTIIQDINSGVIGAILTTIITLILLSNQTESQENLTKSSVVYEEKLKIFNSFLDTIGSCIEDGKLSSQETTKIIHSFSVLRIHISSENSQALEKAIASIDNSFFFFDENSIPNLDRLIVLYTDMANVFRQELYGFEASNKLNTFDFTNLKNVLYRKRMSIIKPSNFNELLIELKSNSNILHTSNKSGLTIVYDINDELINSLIELNHFMEKLINELSDEILLTYEINRLKINDISYSGIPWIKLNFRNTYFAFYGLTETKRLWIGKVLPEMKQVAAFEVFETDKLVRYKQQIINEFQSIILDIKNKNSI